MLRRNKFQPRMVRSITSDSWSERPFRFGAHQSEAETVGQSRHHLILQLEQVGHILLEAVRPKMRTRLRIDQLRVDAHAVPSRCTEPSST